MLDLIAPKKLNVGFAYITDNGSIATMQGELEYFINAEGNAYESFEAIINKYSSNINVLKGYSSYNTLSHNEISTANFSIYTNETLSHNVMFMSYLGGIKQAFTDSLMHEMSTAMHTVGNEFSNVYVKFNTDVGLTTIVNATPRGVETKTVKFSLVENSDVKNEFQEHAYTSFNNIITDTFKENIIYNEAHVGKDFSIKGNCIVDSLLNINDNQSICDSVYNDLYIIAKDANIDQLIIEE